jgi:DHA1 family tetracycline resistance protein-like MFS transporter
VPFYVAGVLASVNAVVAIVRVPETKARAQVAHAGAQVAHQGAQVAHLGTRGRRHAATPMLRRLAIVGFITTVAFTAFESTFALLGHRRFGFTEGSTAAVFLGIGLVLVVVQGGAYARLVTHFGVHRLYVVGVAMLVVGLALASIAEAWAVLVAALFMLSVGQGVASPSVTTLVTEFAPAERRGEALGFQQSAGAVGRIVGPPAAGLMYDHVGIWSPYAAAAGLCTVAVVALVTWGMHRPVTGAAV